MNKLANNDILDLEEKFQDAVGEFIKEGREFFEILSKAVHLLSTDEFKPLNESESYTEDNLYDFVNELWNRYYE